MMSTTHRKGGLIFCVLAVGGLAVSAMAQSRLAPGALNAPERGGAQPGEVDSERPSPRGVQLPAARQANPMSVTQRGAQHSVARLWNEELLDAIRRDTPRPPVHSRNLFHVSAAMYDAWAAYDSDANAVLRHESASAVNVEAARNEAISYAAYRVLTHRFANSPGQTLTQAAIDGLMGTLGYNINITTTAGQSPAAVGNRIAAAIITQSFNDGSNELGNFADTSGYAPFNGPLVVENPGTGGMNDINRWQPLVVPGAMNPQGFLAPHWGDVTPFALTRPAPGALYTDPGPPPLIGGIGDAIAREDILEVIRASGTLDPDDGVMINISPRFVGNNPLGTQDGTGHPVNPETGMPYPDNFVLRGDWGRVLAEFWADGPLSSTPPGHWNEIANEVADYPGFEKRIGGVGPIVDDLEWDVKLYLALNGAVHDSAIGTWEVKAVYDFARPISHIREMGALGQSTDDTLPSYHPNGLPLEDGVVELITADSTQPGERHEHLAAHIGEIALFSWIGHPGDPLNEYAGCGWVRAVEWIPYQQFDFVTPPFAGYTSGHSGFSRSSAEVLTAMTGSPYFPGGLGEFLATTGPGGFDLGFEFGPNQDVLLQWATYYDAADEAGISRIYGGIHPALDDFPGRIMGAVTGQNAAAVAKDYFAGEAHGACPADWNGDGAVTARDLTQFMTDWRNGNADFNFDGVTDQADLQDFVAAWVNSCPWIKKDVPKGRPTR
ncbi:MAG: hypothetical protein EA376_03035 [Phycisphaeraceae bacterium]|nr:MAG: hypothetical protein EA376_03035 [Phycisphaeraceae bacterium]